MKNSIKIPVKSLRLVLTMCLLFFPQLPAHAEPELYFVHNDHLNTPQMLTDQNGQVVWKVESQTPFGVVETNDDVDGDGQAIEFNLRFPGQYYDSETGLSYNYFRDYDPSLGRYLQSDPIGLRGGLNTYAYVSGNSLKYYDPFGLSERDVQRIRETFNSYVRDATSSGNRASPGSWNNMNRSFYDWSGGNIGSNYKGCWEQANDLKDKLNDLELDDDWDFSRIDRGWKPTPHSWVDGKSSNPSDPNITADPWADRFVQRY
ncbi:RHS repeat-associated core domain-containing protein [Teredinibacter turnerae]|uniref:RHS repeat domain-containing protein n=1 Tax=Teredinibacter turnerae TaxID=2426 RepID=UPI00037023D8|nr:RHS repeat-associated core domain-containing protein [Teredinibacter turnerae]